MAALPASAEAPKRLVLIDQDGSGPADSNQMSMMVLLKAPQVEVLGITIASGNVWRDEGVQHTLRMRTRAGTGAAEPLFGRPRWQGAWGRRPPALALPQGAVLASNDALGPWEVPPLPEGAPSTRPLDEDAAHFLVRQVRAHPGEVTIYAAGPLTNVALAVAIEPRFAEMTRGLVLMGSSLSPQKDEDPEFLTNPRYEFNFWFDPEAAHIVLRAPWPRVDVTSIDVAVKAMFTQEIYDAISRARSPAAKYIATWAQERYYPYDELAACAWLDPSLITKGQRVYMDVDLSHGPSYGNTLTWPEALKPAIGVRPLNVQLDLDLARFTKMFVGLMSAP